MIATAHGLSEVIHRLQTLAREFQAILQEETRQLRQWPLPDPWLLQNNKLIKVRELEDCHSALQASLHTPPGGHGQASLLDVINSQLAEPERTIWKDTLDLLAECKRINSANGISLNRQQLAMRQSLDMLLGSLDQGMTYGRLGGRQHASRNASLGVA